MAVAIRTATRIQDQDDAPALGAGQDGYALTWNNATGAFVATALVTDHGALSGLSDDDHTGYALLAGRAGGQTLYGGTDANDDITIHGTSNATRTTSYVLLQPTAGNVGIGTTAPLVTLHIVSPSYAHIAVERTSDKWIRLFSGNSIDGVEPTVTWKSSQNLWLVSSGSINDTAMSNGGVVISGANNYLGIGGAPSQPLRVRMISGGAHNSVVNVAAFVRRNGFASAAGFGQSMSWFLESSTTENTAAASLTVLWYEATHATRKADLVLTAYDTAEREGLRIRGNGSAPAIGFLGAGPQARIAHVADPAGGGTVDAEARTAINSILATLENFGFHATS